MSDVAGPYRRQGRDLNAEPGLERESRFHWASR